jgi:hypothetical protein
MNGFEEENQGRTGLEVKKNLAGVEGLDWDGQLVAFLEDIMYLCIYVYF